MAVHPTNHRDSISRALQDCPQLQRFILCNVTPTGNKLGTGSYGWVEELNASGIICAGKIIHEILINPSNEGAEIMVQKYYREIELLSTLEHSNIVKFYGICFLEAQAGYSPNLPVLVMERLQRSLDDLLETSPNVPLNIKCSILQDVSRGLRYLHSHNPVIIHRDLTARNVLLNSAMEAKIADMGNSRIVKFMPGQSAKTMTKGVPGTGVYMPPEAFQDPPKYGSMLDMFSFGHLTLFTMIQVFPGNLLPPNYLDPDTSRLIARDEIQRREKYMPILRRKFGDSHAVVSLVTQCLQYSPTGRPSASQALQLFQQLEHNMSNEELEMEERELLQELKKMKGVEGRKTTPLAAGHYVQSRGIMYNMKRGGMGGNVKNIMIVVSVGSELPDGVQVQPRVRDSARAERATRTHGRLPRVVPGLHEEAAADLMAAVSQELHNYNSEVVRLCIDVPGKQRSKEYYFKTIEEFLKQCQQPVAVLYYLGHSEEKTGNWCFKDGTISFQEIFDLYRKHHCGKLLSIMPDCCYSGKWVTECAKELDRLGISPCGHRARENGILLKVFASCQPNQKASEPCYSVEAAKLANDGTLTFHANKRASEMQSFCAIDCTKLICLRGPNESCRSVTALKNWTWQDAVGGVLKNRLFVIRIEDRVRQSWCIVLLSSKSEEYKEQFLKKMISSMEDAAKWGYVLESGQGEDPSQSIRDKVSSWMAV